MATRIAVPSGEYCAAFSSTCASAVAVSLGSSRTAHHRPIVHLHVMPPQRLLDLLARGRKDFRGTAHSTLGRDRPGIDPRHRQDVLEQPRQPLDFGQDDISL